MSKVQSWHVFRGGQHYGPITDDELRILMQQGKIDPEDYLWCPEFKEWVQLGNILAHQSLPSRNSRFASLKRFLVRQFSKRASILKRLHLMVSRPSEFADKFIQESNSPALFASIKFYVKIVGLVFAIAVISDQFSFIQGTSEIRGLVVRLMPQVIVGTVVLFSLLRITGNPIPIDGLIQTILYVDGAYLLFDALLLIPWSYFNYAVHGPPGAREIDLFATEFEKCMATNSLTYWLMRGDLQFFVYDGTWKSKMQWLIDQRRYITVIPFLFLFSYAIRRKYKVNVLVGVISTAIAFISANEAFDWVDGKVRQIIANNSNCRNTYVQTLVGKYSADRIAKQLEFQLGSLLRQRFPDVTQTVSLEGNEFLVAFKITNAKQLSEVSSLLFRSTYCSDHPYWVATREIKYNLAAFIFEQDRTNVSLLLKPEDCRT